MNNASWVVDEFSLYEAPNHTGTPERNLLMAVLERAILDLVGNDKKEIEEAEAWLFGENNFFTNESEISANQDQKPHSEFSFPWICEELELDLPTIVDKIKKMPKRGAKKIAPWYFAKLV